MLRKINKSNIILPSFVSSNKDNIYSCNCKSCKIPKIFNDFNSLVEHLKMFNINYFECPEKDCYNFLPAIKETIKAHTNDKHFKNNLSIYCKYCNNYISCLHFHCYECSNNGLNIFFNTNDERVEHLKSNHVKWWLEKPCKYNDKCPGINGICQFNHFKYDKTFITDKQETFNTICETDKPWMEKTRCTKLDCNKDHFWGHIRYVIRKKIQLKKIGNNAIPKIKNNKISNKKILDYDSDDGLSSDSSDLSDSSSISKHSSSCDCY